MLLQTLLCLFSHSIHQILAIVLELNSKRQYPSSEREEESRRLEFASSTKCENSHPFVVVVQ